MPALHQTGTLSGSAQSLLALFFGAAEPVGGPNDVAVSSLNVQADTGNSNVIYFGTAGVSATDFGFEIPIPTAGVPAFPYVTGPFDRGGPFRLSEIHVIGTADEILHVLYIWW